MNNREKEIIEAVKLDIKNFQENCNKSEIVRFLDYTIILGKELNFSDEFMGRLYFLRYYYNIGGNEKWETMKNKNCKELLRL